VIILSRCAYCKKKGADYKTGVRMWTDGKLKNMELAYCSDRCKQHIHNFIDFHNQYAPKFMWVTLIWLLFFLVIPFALQLITGNQIFVAKGSPLMLALAGALLMKYPLGIVTNHYYERLGIRYTTLFIRLTGLIMLTVGLATVWG